MSLERYGGRVNAKWQGGCDAALEAFEARGICCGSCHHDQEDFGMALSEAYMAEGYYEVCCAVLAVTTPPSLLPPITGGGK